MANQSTNRADPRDRSLTTARSDSPRVSKYHRADAWLRGYDRGVDGRFVTVAPELREFLVATTKGSGRGRDDLGSSRHAGDRHARMNSDKPVDVRLQSAYESIMLVMVTLAPWAIGAVDAWAQLIL